MQRDCRPDECDADDLDGLGTWPSTTRPHSVAVTGSRESSRAYVDRGSRAIATWSATYGITVEDTPTPTAHSSQSGCANTVSAGPIPNGSATTAPITTATASRSTPSGAPSGCSRAVVVATRWPSVTYSTNPTPFTTAQKSPAALPSRLTRVSSAIPAAARARAVRLRWVRAPYAARASTPANSMLATVARGARSRAR